MDLKSLSPDELQALKDQLGLTEAATSGRSPFRERQLHDLRLLPTATDPRPTFFMSADPPRHGVDLTKTSPYPRLMWETTTGREITVDSAKEQATYTSQGFVLVPPANAEAPDSAETVRAALAAMSPEDRQACIQAAQSARLAKVQAAMAGLNDADLDAVMASLEPAKRGPGRPRKEDVA